MSLNEEEVNVLVRHINAIWKPGQLIAIINSFARDEYRPKPEFGKFVRATPFLGECPRFNVDTDSGIYNAGYEWVHIDGNRRCIVTFGHLGGSRDNRDEYYYRSFWQVTPANQDDLKLWSSLAMNMDRIGIR